MGIVIADRKHIISAPNTENIKADALRRHNEEWYYFLENLPKHSGITFNYLDSKNNLSNNFLTTSILSLEKMVKSKTMHSYIADIYTESLRQYERRNFVYALVVKAALAILRLAIWLNLA